jgi:hypothetical protein
MVVGIAGAGLPAPNNDAAALCRVSTARDSWPVSVAAGPIVMASRFFGVVSCRLAISASVGSR